MITMTSHVPCRDCAGCEHHYGTEEGYLVACCACCGLATTYLGDLDGRSDEAIVRFHALLEALRREEVREAAAVDEIVACTTAGRDASEHVHLADRARLIIQELRDYLAMAEVLEPAERASSEWAS